MNLQENNKALLGQIIEAAKGVYNAVEIYDESSQPLDIRLWAQTAAAEAMSLSVCDHDCTLEDSERLGLARSLKASVYALLKNVNMWNQGGDDARSLKLTAVEKDFGNLVAEADYFEEINW